MIAGWTYMIERNARRLTANVVVVCMLLMGSPLFVHSSFGQTVEGVNIEFLNPSSFSLADGIGILVSDKRPMSPDEGDTTYRLSAWVNALPPNPAVEFEILKAGISLLTLDEVTLVGSDTFEADWDIPNNLTEGTYTIRATVASGGVGIDTASQDVVINRLAERVEMTYPDSRGSTPESASFGTYAPLANSLPEGGATRGLPIGNIDGRNTGETPGNGASRVRAFYTVSPPGSRPEWISCGTETAPGDPLLGSAANNGVRCTLQAAEHQTFITAVALLANSSNQGFDTRLNGAGDATRVLNAYAQVPSSLSITDGENGRVNANADDSFSCWSVSSLLVDQYAREIAGANLDVHATGPADSLKFGRGLIDDSGQVPDRGGHATEPGFDCFGESDETEPDDQGEHQVIGGPDIKHLETVAGGTSDTGAWSFAIHVPAGAPSPTRATSYFSIWADEADDGSSANDDVFATGELCAAGMVGWGRAPEAPTPGTVPLLGCEPLGPAPEPEPEPEPRPTKDKISLRASDNAIFRGSRVVFSGRVSTVDAGCSSQRRVVLRSRKSGGAFRDRVETISASNGRWTLTRRVYRTRDWRVVARATDDCAALRSRVVRVTIV